jgi:hypothetical protein
MPILPACRSPKRWSDSICRTADRDLDDVAYDHEIHEDERLEAVPEVVGVLPFFERDDDLP